MRTSIRLAYLGLLFLFVAILFRNASRGDGAGEVPMGGPLALVLSYLLLTAFGACLLIAFLAYGPFQRAGAARGTQKNSAESKAAVGTWAYDLVGIVLILMLFGSATFLGIGLEIPALEIGAIVVLSVVAAIAFRWMARVAAQRQEARG